MPLALSQKPVCPKVALTTRRVEGAIVQQDRSECGKEDRPGQCPLEDRHSYWFDSRDALRLTAEFGCLAILCSAVAGHAQTDAATTRPKVMIHVYQYAQVPESLFQSAKEQVAKIFLHAGIETAWRDYPLKMTNSAIMPGSSGTLPSATLVIKILPDSMTRAIRSGRSSLGFAALSPATHRGSEAFVFFDRVKEVTEIRYVIESRLLASVMAHELGHLLLGPGHSGAGVMGGLADRDENMVRDLPGSGRSSSYRSRRNAFEQRYSGA
jgi:hypothetical protein